MKILNANIIRLEMKEKLIYIRGIVFKYTNFLSLGFIEVHMRKCLEISLVFSTCNLFFNSKLTSENFIRQ